MLFLKFQCGVEFLRSFDFATHGSPVLIYLDPPYLMETRSQKTPLYDPEFADWFSHVELLDLILTLNANVMISGYDHPLYNEKLAAWRKTTFTGFARGGSRTECLWMNYAEPSELHDYRYLGSDYRERESIKKQQKRWVAKLRAMPLQKRYALMAAIEEVNARVTPEIPMAAAIAGNAKKERAIARGPVTFPGSFVTEDLMC